MILDDEGIKLSHNQPISDQIDSQDTFLPFDTIDLDQSQHHVNNRQNSSSPPPSSHAPPVWTWFVLAASLLAVSSAGVAFSLIKQVPPITLAAWRLQSTSILLIIGFVVQWRQLDQQSKNDVMDHSTKLCLAASGTSLAIHFGCWVASLEVTSLSHSLLLVCSTPIWLCVYTWARGHSISSGEVWGTMLGFIGTIVLSSAASDSSVTFRGDLAALAASAALIPYLLIGRKLRSWMPLFIYALPVTFLAAFELTCTAVIVEGSKPFASGQHGLFGYVTSRQYLPFVLYLGIVPGIAGHTGINALLRYIDPLVLTLALNTEPLLGSVMGYIAGISSPPGIFTYLGGFLILLATVIVSLASNKREEREKGKVLASAEMEIVFSGGQSFDHHQTEPHDQ